MSDARLVRALTPEIKIISAQAAEVEYVASDASLDCYREILVPGGVDFSRFVKNAPFVDSHDYSTLEKLLGTVTKFEVKGGQVVERVKWAVDVSPLASLGFKLTESGHLKAVSVGFMPGKMVWRDEPEFAEAVKALKLSSDIAVQVRCIHQTWQQIELSACIIGANPNALAKAYKGGTLTEQDIDQFSALLAASKTIAPAAHSADAAAISPRTKLAVLAAIQTGLFCPRRWRRARPLACTSSPSWRSNLMEPVTASRARSVHQVVDVAPAPVLLGLGGLHHRVLGLVEVAGGVLEG